ncbi:hypothetical protein HZH68_010455 [Vespula germanica]|uniref:Methyltransferase NSUN7 n=1 Tax=Vespula germanica TaxID=30212 RepID=A0A834JSG8_VESGE|nr:hypothetical protein HZH68_010455 [Vespula germanica]
MVETRRKDEKETKLRDPQDYEWSPGKLERIVKAKILKEEDTTSLCATFSSNGSMTETYIEPGWRIEDILLAAKVLEEEKTQPCYANEAEMRRVFGLVYDVLRYRNVLNYVLQDVGFWSRNQALKNRERIVWLLLYDMQGRKFSRRGDVVTIKARDQIFKTVGLKDIENALLEVRTHLAASISRLRIAGSALTLGKLYFYSHKNIFKVMIVNKLLPKHLRTGEGIVWSEGDTIASGWINTSNGSINKIELIKELSKEVGLELCENCEVAELDENTYVFDSFCPKVINVHEKTRERIACSSLVREHRFIFLERSLCLGAAAIALAMRIGRLCGPVVLTHSVAPRHTGYLAELLSNVEGAGRLLAFGTGDRRYEYEEYLKKLGITLQQCRVFSEKYTSPPPSVEIDRATVVLATPPSSYIGVKDIVDLVVARGGDTKLLESLTNTDDEFSKTRAVLIEQLTTLKYALTRPNVQFLIYEVHTVLPSETTKMVQQVVDYVNQMATEKYIRECLPKRKALLKEKQGQNTIIKTLTKHSLQSKSSNDEFEEESSITDSSHTEKINQHEESKIPSSTRYDNINVPKSDLFEIQTFDEVYNKDSTQTLEPGCFITVIKRKEIMQFDSLFMIKVAESKGLFGDTDKEQSTSKSTITQTQPIVQTSHVHRVKRKTSAITCDGLSKPSGSIFRSFRTLQSIGEISRSSNEHETRKTRKSTDERISSALTSIKDKVVSRKYRTISSKVFLPYNKTNTLRQRAIKKRKSDSFDILTISEMDAWDQPSSSNKRYNVVSLKKQEGNDKESQRFLSSTALRKSALIRATQRTSFDSILTEQDKPPPLHILEDQEI